MFPPTTPPPVQKVTPIPEIDLEEEDEEAEMEEGEERTNRFLADLNRMYPLEYSPIRMCDENTIAQRPDLQNTCIRLFRRQRPSQALINLGVPINRLPQFIRQDRCNRQSLIQVNTQMNEVMNELRINLNQLRGLDIAYENTIRTSNKRLMCYITHSRATGFNHEENKVKLRAKCNVARASIRASIEQTRREMLMRRQILANYRQQQVFFFKIFFLNNKIK